MESFFKTLKVERTHLLRYGTRALAKSTSRTAVRLFNALGDSGIDERGRAKARRR